MINPILGATGATIGSLVGITGLVENHNLSLIPEREELWKKGEPFGEEPISSVLQPLGFLQCGSITEPYLVKVYQQEPNNASLPKLIATEQVGPRMVKGILTTENRYRGNLASSIVEKYNEPNIYAITEKVR